MLSWSSQEAESEVDLAELGRGGPGVTLPLARELHAFASAVPSGDGRELERARRELVAAAERLGQDGSAVMIDAAAVAANFEMMTRLADGTGARFPETVVDERAPLAAALGVADVVSRR
jgi:hypothetical protein